MRWQYGRKDDLSFTYNGINRTEMIEYISKINNEKLKVSEIICHIPLSIDMFNHVFEQYGGKRNLLKIYQKRIIVDVELNEVLILSVYYNLIMFYHLLIAYQQKSDAVGQVGYLLYLEF